MDLSKFMQAQLKIQKPGVGLSTLAELSSPKQAQKAKAEQAQAQVARGDTPPANKPAEGQLASLQSDIEKLRRQARQKVSEKPKTQSLENTALTALTQADLLAQLAEKFDERDGLLGT